MSEYEARGTYGAEVTGWVGWVWFAAIMLMIVGAFDIIQGIIALVSNTFQLGVEGGVLVLNLTTWAWLHIIVGLALVIIGVGVGAGQTWARVFGVIIAGLNALAQLPILGAYPFWAMLMVILNVVIIYALVVHGREAAVA